MCVNIFLVFAGNESNISRTVIVVVQIIFPAIIKVKQDISWGNLFIKRYLNNALTSCSGEFVDEIGNVESLQLGFDTVKVTTYNFSDANKLGQGGFGVVYKVNVILLLTLNILSPKSEIA